mgnify:CR=1 FL=1
MLTGWLSKSLSEALHAKVSVSKVALGFNGKVLLSDLYVEDLEQDTLLYVQLLEAKLEPLRLSMFDDGEISIESARLVTGVFHLHTFKGDSVNNMQFIIDYFKSDQEEQSETKAVGIVVNEVELVDFKFDYHNYNAERVGHRVDWSHLNLNNIQFKATDFSFHEDSLHVQVAHLLADDWSGLDIDSLQGDAFLYPGTFGFETFQARVNDSYLNADLAFNYSSFSVFNQFIDSVEMRIDLKQTVLRSQDIALFADGIPDIPHPVEVSGRYKGEVSNFRVKDLDVRLLGKSYLEGDLRMSGLPDVENTFVILDVDDLLLSPKEFLELNILEMKPAQIEQMYRLGDVSFDGSFTGFFKEFVAYGNVQTAVGRLKTDLKLNAKTEVMSYDGNLAVQQFDLKALFPKQDLVGKTSFKIALKGEGIDQEELDATLKGKISQLQLKDYLYSDISIDGVYEENGFDGTLIVNDSNLDLRFEGQIDFGEDIPVYKFDSKIGYAYLNRLNLIENDSNVKLQANLHVDFIASDLDHMKGSVNINDINYQVGSALTHLDTFEFTAVTDSTGKTFAVNSDNGSMWIRGKFNSAGIQNGAKHVAHALFPRQFPLPEIPLDTSQYFDMKWRLDRLGSMAHQFIPQIDVIENLEVETSYRGMGMQFETTITTPHSVIQGIELNGLSIYANSNSTSGDINIQSREVNVLDSLSYSNLEMKNHLGNDQLRSNLAWFSEDLSQKAGDFQFDVNLIGENAFKLVVDTGFFVVTDSVWTMTSNNYIIQDSTGIQVSNLGASNGRQSIVVSGSVGEDVQSRLEVELSNFEISGFNALIQDKGFTLGGLSDGSFNLNFGDDGVYLDSKLDLSQLEINDFKFGSGKIHSSFDNVSKVLSLDARMRRGGIETFYVKGNYTPQNNDSLDILLKTDVIGLSPVAPFLEQYVDLKDGYFNGRLDITGTIKQPEIDGALRFYNVEAYVPMLNTAFFLDSQQVNIDHNLLHGEKLEIKDELENVLLADVRVKHENYQKFKYVVDLEPGSSGAFKAMNTSEKESPYFYGLAYVEKGTSVKIYNDDEDHVMFDVKAVAGKGTVLNLPLTDATSFEKNSFINFVNYDSDEGQATELEGQEKVSGIGLDLEAIVNPSSEIRLIFDETSGDVITAQGNSEISFTMSTDGDIALYGTYRIESGDYLFTFNNILNKRFLLQPNGTIAWNGDPMEGLIDLNAVYKVRARLSDLGMATALDSATASQRVRVDLIMNLTGNYLNPDIIFQFGLPENYDSYEQVLNNLEHGEANKQAFSLLFLGSFVALEGSGTGAAASSNFLGSNSMEVLSNQLGNWLSKISNDFDVGFTYIPGDEVSSNEVELALSTQLFNDRVIVEGNFGVHDDNTSTTSTEASQLVGDFEVIYKMTEDGKVRSKVFNRSNLEDPVRASLGPYTQGVGISYTEDFQTWGNLGCRIRKRFTVQSKSDSIDCDALQRAQLLQKQAKYNAKIERKIERARKD